MKIYENFLCMMLFSFKQVMDPSETQRKGHPLYASCQKSFWKWRKMMISTESWRELIKELEWDISQIFQTAVMWPRCLASFHILQRNCTWNKWIRKFIQTTLKTDDNHIKINDLFKKQFQLLIYHQYKISVYQNWIPYICNVIVKKIV